MSSVSSRALRVVVIDADPFATRAIVRVLSAAPDIQVVGSALEGPAGMSLAAEHHPDVVVLDVDLRDADGVELIGALHTMDPPPGIVVLSSRDDPDLAFRCLRAGANGFLPKRVSVDALPRIVRAVGKGEAVLTRTLTTKLVERLREMPEGGRGLRPVRSQLSSREWEVLDLLRAGASTRSIAEELGLSTETVRSHVKRILRKLDAHSRAEAAELAGQLLRPGSQSSN